MIPILLLILKIIGIVLLVLISLLLLLIFTVLLVPVRYRISAAQGKDQFSMEGTVSWLLHLIHARISMIGTKPHIRVRIFGKVVFDNLKVKKTRTKVAKKRKSVKKNIRNRTNMETKNPVVSKTPQIDEASKKDDILKNDTTDPLDIVKDFADVKTEDIPKIIEGMEKSESTKHRQSLLQKIRDIVKKIKEIISTFFQGMKDKIRKWIESSVNIKRKIALLLEFVKDEINQEAFKLTYFSLIKLLKHILPTKLKSSIIFGTGDPCSTGQALGALSILYSFYGDKIQITPDFENKRFEGRLAARGRIRLVTILIIVIKLILDKRFKYLKSNMKTLKEAL